MENETAKLQSKITELEKKVSELEHRQWQEDCDRMRRMMGVVYFNPTTRRQSWFEWLLGS